MNNVLRVLPVMCLVACVAATKPQDPVRISVTTLDSTIGSIVDSQHIPSAVVEVAAGTHVVYARAFGERDMERGIPADLNTRYEIGSMTKQFTAAAIVQLAEAGKLAFDDRVSRFLPDAPHADMLTIRELLTMRSGLPAYNETPGFRKVLSKPGGYQQIVALVKNKPLHFAPGSDFEYSNTNYILLGRIVEVVSHQGFDAYIRGHELKAAGMTETSTVASERQLADVAIGYGSGIPPWTPYTGEWFSSAGDIVSTAGDLLKWNQALTAGRIVDPKSFELMTRTSPNDQEGDSPRYYGFGLEMRRMDGEPVIEHGGSTLAFQAYMAFFPTENLRIVVLTNGEKAAPEEIAQKVFETVYPEAVAAYQKAQAARPAGVSGRSSDTNRFEGMLVRLMRGEVDRSQLTASLSAQLSPAVLRSLSSQAAGLGPLVSFTYKDEKAGNGGHTYHYTARYAHATMLATFTLNAESKVSDLDVSPQE